MIAVLATAFLFHCAAGESRACDASFPCAHPIDPGVLPKRPFGSSLLQTATLAIQVKAVDENTKEDENAVVSEADDFGPPAFAAGGSMAASKKHFSGIFYINRDVDTMRRENMEKALSGVDRQATRIVRLQAVNADEVEQDPEFDRLMPKGCCTNMAVHECIVAKLSYGQGMRSCACDFMHRKAYHRIAESPDGFYLVLEDDISFTSSDWESKAMAYLATAPPDWDMLRIGYWGDTHPDDRVSSSPGWLRAFRDRGKYPKYQGYYGAHAVVLTPGRAKKLVELMTIYYGDFADHFTKDANFGDATIHSYVSIVSLVGTAGKFGSTRTDGIVE